jgi:peptide/nickel transport system substrate-binding protein/oligopeptide transport system substrate-binding protein
MRLGKKFTWMALMSLASISVFLLAGCGSSSSGGATPAPDAQQVLRIGDAITDVDVSGMDPGKTGDLYSFTMETNIFPALLALDNNDNVVPDSATALPDVSSDGLTLTFHIKSGLQWSDGTPIDANTYAYSINRSADPCTGSPVTYYMYAIAGALAFSSSQCTGPHAKDANPVDSQTLIGTSITATDPQTLVIKLAKPYSYAVDAFVTNPYFAQPKQLITQYGLKNWTSHLTDNGGFGGYLFKLTTWDHAGHIDFTRDTTYGGPAAKLRQLDYVLYKQPATAYNDYKTGNTDVNWGQSTPPPQYQAAKKGSDFHQTTFLDDDYIQENWSKAPFNNELARQAFELAINKTTLANNVSDGEVLATNNIVPKGMPGYDPNIVGPDGTNNLTGNPQKAQQLITQYAQQACGGQISKCPSVTFLNGNTNTNIQESQALLQMWQQAMPGYPISIKNEDFNTLLGQIYGGVTSEIPQFYAIGWIVDFPHPWDWLSLQFLPTSFANFGQVNDAAATALMNQADVAPASQSNSLYNQAEQELVTQVAWLVLDQQLNIWEQSPKVQGLQGNPAGYLVAGNLGQIYMSA